MSESTALLLLTVFAFLPVKPELAQLSLHLLFPAVLVFDSTFMGLKGYVDTDGGSAVATS